MKDRKIQVKATRTTTTVETVEFYILAPAYASPESIERLGEDYIYSSHRPQLDWKVSAQVEDAVIKIVSTKETT